MLIFDIVQNGAHQSLKIKQKLEAQQMGEYFGYTIITEDFDADGFTDIAVGAPFNSFDQFYDNGAVYIYKNQNGVFKLDYALKTEYQLSGRFGTTLSKIGDINNDGYKGMNLFGRD